MKLISLIVLAFFISQQASAAKIIQTKANKILIDLEGEEAQVEQKLYLINGAGKKIGIASITQAKNGKAIAIINKGTSSNAESIQLIESSISADPSSSDNNAPPKVSTKGIYRVNGVKYTALLTLISNTMNTKQADGTQPVPNQEEVALKGSSFGIAAGIDIPVVDWFTLRGVAGYEPFSAAGTARFSSCDALTSTNCTATITYASAGLYGRIDLTKSRALVWIAGGMAIKYPIGKSTTALRTDDIKMTYTIAAAGGLDYFINNKNFVPVSVEYQMFPSSDTVSANSIMIRGGYGWSY